MSEAPGPVDALLQQSYLARREHRSQDGRPLCLQAVAFGRKAGYPALLARALTGLGQIERDLRNFEAAIPHYEEAVAIYRTLDLPLHLAHSPAPGRHSAEDGVGGGSRGKGRGLLSPIPRSLPKPSRNRPARPGDALRGYALLTEATGRPEESRRLWEETREIYLEVGVRAGVDECERRLAALAE